MSFCFQNPDALIPSTNYTCTQALSNKLTVLQNESYLRPNTGGALLPWIYTVLIILIHTPIVVIRVVKWEIMQAWSICFAVFTIVVVTQSYVSTQFDPARILIWTPIILVIDAGSMIQVFFLVIEAKKLRLGPRTLLVDPPEKGQQDIGYNAGGTQQYSSLVTRYRRSRQGHQERVGHQDQSVQLSEHQPFTSSQRPPTPSEGTTEPAPSSLKHLDAPRTDQCCPVRSTKPTLLYRFATRSWSSCSIAAACKVEDEFRSLERQHRRGQRSPLVHGSCSLVRNLRSSFFHSSFGSSSPRTRESNTSDPQRTTAGRVVLTSFSALRYRCSGRRRSCVLYYTGLE